MPKQFFLLLSVVLTLLACSKTEVSLTPTPIIKTLNINSVQVNRIGLTSSTTLYGIAIKTFPVIKIVFSDTINLKSLNTSAITWGGTIGSNYSAAIGENPKTLLITSTVLPAALSAYTLTINSGSNLGGNISASFSANFITQIDSTAKFPTLSDDDLLTKIQQQTLHYFTDYAHPISGMARERLNSGETVTTGGTGFGLMAVLAGINRGFVTRTVGYTLINKVVTFLNEKADKFHGAYPHWMNGSTGKVIPFSTKDDGGDLVETAYLMQGLLTVNEYFNSGSVVEKAMCDTIQKLWKNVEWDWYRQNGQNTLYWHWSPDYAWAINMPIAGYDEALIVYVLAAASPTHPITKSVYDLGWAKSGAIRNGKLFEGITLPLGSDYGGPLFFAHYSFLGLDPRKLSDQYANYWVQNVAHSQINNRYCIRNPQNNYGYSADSWGLTASDISTGYTASSPTNDVGTIAPTAALSSFPYTPTESMKAARFFYYQLGDKLWSDYGLKDAFNLNQCWFASSYLAIDQGPVVVMIENYRSQLLWNLFMQNSDVKNGLNSLGFSY
jgi:hypothetical protein